MRLLMAWFIFTIPGYILQAQSIESYYPKNLGRIVEIASPSGILNHCHNLIGYDSSGLVKRGSSENTYKIFGSLPSETNLQDLNGWNRFGAPSSNDCYEIRFGIDSSRYWINLNNYGSGGNLALNHLPFSVYHVGPKSSKDTTVTVGTKLCIKVSDQDGNGIYSPGERIFVLSDLAMPLDSNYDSLSLRLTNPFPQSKSVITNLRFGLTSVEYTQGSFNVPVDGFIPPAGTVIRLVAQTADTSRPFIYMQDSFVVFKSDRYSFPFSYYSYEAAALQLINAPAGMSIAGDSIIWQVDASQLGNEYSVILQMTNGTGTTQKPFTAKAHAIYPEIQMVCGGIHRDSLYNAIEDLQNRGTRFALAPNRRDVAEWIKNKFIQIGYPTARLDSFYLTNLQWPFGSGTYYPQWNYNVIAELPGAIEPDSVYILGGHHDNILYPYSQGDPFAGCPGADDNASGTVAAIEVARVYKKFNYQPNHTIKFVTFATEEFGLYGSKNYAQKARNSNERIQMMINNDMISTCQDTVNYWRVNLEAYPNSENATTLARQAVEQYTNLKGYIVSNSASSGSDSRSFYDQGYKTVYFEEYQFSPFYHSQSDLLTNCNTRYMAEIVKAACAMLMLENGLNITVSANEPVKVVHEFALLPNYPNPFNPSTTIRYQLPDGGKVSLKIYNAIGQEVRTLINSNQTAGEHSIIWDGKNNYGSAVTSGVYIYRLQTGRYAKSMKMILVR